MKMRTYKRVPIPDVLYKIMKRYLEKYHIGSEDYVFQNKRGGAYQYGSFKWQMKELFNKRQDIFKGYDFKERRKQPGIRNQEVQTWKINFT